MNTLTHLLAAAAVLAKPKEHKRNLAVVAGALTPDVSIYVFFACMVFFTDLSMSEIWREAYWTEPWQMLGAVSNSVPLALGALLIGLWRKSTLLICFSLALLVHAALDFPVHADDAHRHFWPVSDWRFQSPVSYWDPNYHGMVGSLIELAVFALATILLWRRFKIRWVRTALGVNAVIYFVLVSYALFFFSP